MKIAYVGNFSQSHCTEVHLAATLESLGHFVIRLQEDGYSQEELGNILDQAKFDLFLFTRTWGKTVTLGHLAQLRERKIPSASYHLDLYVGLKREDGLDHDPFWRTDFVFTPDGDPASQAVFEAKGINHHYIKPGVFKPECYMAEPSAQFVEDRSTDVLFVGGGQATGKPHQYGHPEWAYRGQLIKFLEDTYGERFAKYGYPQPTIRNEELNYQYAVSKVVVGDSLCLQNFTHPYYWSDRVYETLGRGGFIIHPFITGMDEEFTDGKTIVFYEYGNWEQLKEKIDYYLEHEDEREAIRLAGHEFVKNYATYNDRLKQMLGVIGGAVTVPTPDTVPLTTTRDMRKKDRGRFNGLRADIFARDNYCCVNCGMTMSDHLEKYGKSLTIDHIDGNGRNSKEPNNDPENLQTLCLPCHGKKDGDRTSKNQHGQFGSPIKISLGAGTEPEEGFVNVDIVELEGIQVVHNLMHFPYPFEDESAEFIRAKDLIEHLATHLPDGRSTVLAFVDECHRILQTGGTLWIQTPSHDADFLWIDPTHVRGYDLRSFDFFDPETDFGRATGFYSKSKFKVTASRLENGNLQFEMVKQ